MGKHIIMDLLFVFIADKLLLRLRLKRMYLACIAFWCAVFTFFRLSPGSSGGPPPVLTVPLVLFWDWSSASARVSKKSWGYSDGWLMLFSASSVYTILWWGCQVVGRGGGAEHFGGGAFAFAGVADGVPAGCARSCVLARCMFSFFACATWVARLWLVGVVVLRPGSVTGSLGSFLTRSMGGREALFWPTLAGTGMPSAVAVYAWVRTEAGEPSRGPLCWGAAVVSGGGWISLAASLPLASGTSGTAWETGTGAVAASVVSGLAAFDFAAERAILLSTLISFEVSWAWSFALAAGAVASCWL